MRAGHVMGGMLAAAAIAGAVTLFGPAPVAEAYVPCGFSKTVAANGATLYRTAIGFTPKGNVRAGSHIRDGQYNSTSKRVFATGHNGWISIYALYRNPGQTCAGG